MNVGVETRPLGDGSSAGAAAKHFVGVSQVFNSLNDYRNNVKSLETHETYDWTLESAQRNEEGQGEGGVSTRVTEVEDNDDHEDINKFSEAQAKQSKLGDEITVSSSESLTTSSCSTFSSGPSPGNDSNSDEPSTPAESDKPSALELPPKVEQDHQPVESVAVEDLAVGLSSISITTESQSILPCEVTASSALGKVLNELSEETSTELDTQSQPQQAADKDILPAVSGEKTAN